MPNLQAIWLAGFVSQVTFTLTLMLLAWSDRRSVGTRWLAGACGLQLLGTAVRQVSSPAFREAGEGWRMSLLPIVFLCLYMGLRWFALRRPLRTWAGPIAVGGSVLLALGVALRSVPAGTALSRLVALVVMGWTLPVLLRGHFPQLRRTAVLTAILIAVSMLVLSFRTVLDLGLVPGDFLRLEMAARAITMVTFTLLCFSSVAMFAAESKRRLHEESRQDSLTKLNNRRSLEELARLAVRTAQRNGHPLTLLMLDMDRFKELNDTFGHHVGDRALRAMGRILRAEVLSHDISARMGGEEFAILLPGCDLEQAAFVAERLRQKLETLHLTAAGTLVRLTVSIGVSQLAPDETRWDNMLRRADRALYQAKR